MQTFSIIVPLLGNTQANDNTLASVLQTRPDSCQVIAVHGPSYQDPHELAKDDVTLIGVDGRPNLIRYLNYALDAAKGTYVGLVRPGACLTDNWDDSVTRAFSGKTIGSVSPLLVSAKRTKQVVASGVGNALGFRRVIIGSGKSVRACEKNPRDVYGPTTWAGFYRRDLLDAIGWIDEKLDPFYLDLEIGLCLSTLGFGCQPCPECIVTIEAPKLVTRESVTPHGTSAQRAFCRHVLHVGTTSNRIQSGLVRMTEMLTSPFQMWKFKHAMQRAQAARFRDKDEIFSDDISVAARRLRRGTIKPRLKVVDQEDPLGESAQFEAAGRNATTLVSEKRRLAMQQRSNRESGKRAA